jgi:hypothetical protein
MGVGWGVLRRVPWWIGSPARPRGVPDRTPIRPAATRVVCVPWLTRTRDAPRYASRRHALSVVPRFFTLGDRPQARATASRIADVVAPSSAIRTAIR